MKEYKTISLSLGLRNRIQKIEDTLNQYAREGWELKFMHQNLTFMVFERDKNR